MKKNQILFSVVLSSILGVGLYACKEAVPFEFRYFSLDHKGSWARFDPLSKGIESKPGYSGSVFDGQYVYFVPFADSVSRHGEVFRYNTYKEFTSTTAWEAYDPSVNGLGTDPVGYVGGTFDGRYVYFAPFRNNSGGPDTHHGEVLRFDTHGGFSAISSWQAYDPANNGVGTDPTGFQGAVYCGAAVYFVPTRNTTDTSGEVLRYDPNEDFESTAGWKAYDPSANGVGTHSKGFVGGVCDGRYVYFVPNNDGVSNHGEVLRLDTSADFETVGAWSTFDAGANGVGTDPDGYYSGVFDGRYVYFSPYNNGTDYHGEVLRYDTEGAFDSASSWSVFDAEAAFGSGARAFVGAFFDGRYVRFLPLGLALPLYFLEYDTQAEFTSANSWRLIDPDAGPARPEMMLYKTPAFDGRFFYFAPAQDVSGPTKTVHRFEAKTPYALPSSIKGGSFF